jgi:hypothetical protein
MKFYIKINNGQPEGYPITHDNFIVAYPDIDTENLSEEFFVCIQEEYPTDLKVYEKCEEYIEVIDNVVYRKYQKFDMTQQEIKEKQELYKSISTPTFPSWEFSEEHCAYMPPPPDSDPVNDPKGWYQDELEYRYEWDDALKEWVKRYE